MSVVVIPLQPGCRVTLYRHGFTVNYSVDTKRVIWYKHVIRIERTETMVEIRVNDMLDKPIKLDRTIEAYKTAVDDIYNRILEGHANFMENHWKWPIEELVMRVALEPAVGTEFKEAQMRQVKDGMNL